MKVSIFLTSLGGIYRPGSKFFTAPPKRVGKFVTSNAVISAMPLLPARIFAHDSSTLSPTGQTMPSPVMTTRRLLLIWFLPVKTSLVQSNDQRVFGVNGT